MHSPYNNLRPPDESPRRTPKSVVAALIVATIVGGGMLVNKTTTSDTSKPQSPRSFNLGGALNHASSSMTIAESTPSTQGSYTLIATTKSNDIPLPDAVGNLCARRLVGMLPWGDGVGFWIQSDNGVGIIHQPLKKGQNKYRVGNSIVSLYAPPNLPGLAAPFITQQSWSAVDGCIYPPGRAPYRAEVVWNLDLSAGDPQSAPVTGSDIMFVPTNFASRYRCLATPLDASLKPVAESSTLTAYPAGDKLIYVRVPQSYPVNTAAIALSITDTMANQSVKWIASNPPPTLRSLPDGAAVVTTASTGPVSIKGFARVSDDASNVTDASASSNGVINFDDHNANGLPPILCRVQITSSKTIPQGDSWSVKIRKIDPEWVTGDSSQSGPFVPQNYATNTITMSSGKAGTIASKQFTVGGTFGAANRLVHFAMDVVHSKSCDETVTLKGARTTVSSVSGHRQLWWAQSTSVVSASGVLITALNSKPDSDPTATLPQGLWNANNLADIYLAVRPPYANAVAGQATPWTSSAALDPTSPYKQLFRVDLPDVWQSFCIPGEPTPGPLVMRRRFPGQSALFQLYRNSFMPSAITVALPENADKSPMDIKLRLHSTEVLETTSVSLTVPVTNSQIRMAKH